MKKIISFIFCAVAFIHLYAQNEIKPGDKGSYMTRETYSSLEESPGVNEGSYAMWYEGMKIISGNYSNNKKSGLWKYSNIDGIIFFEGSYVDDKKDGSWKYYKNQKPLAVVYYKNDEMDSLWQSFHENGKVQSRINYTMGKRNGAYQLYYDNGNLAIDDKYLNDEIIDTAKHFYKDGTVQYIIQYKDSRIYNVLAMNDSIGNKQDFGTFVNGTGTLKQYYSNGKICSEVQYTNGDLNGTATLYRRNEQLRSVLNFINDTASGKQTEYDENGLVESEGECLHGFKSGKWSNYYKGVKSYEKEYSQTDSIKISIPNYFPPSPSLEEMPRAQGGEKGMMIFIARRVKYPSGSRDNNVSGTVYVTFVINKQGNMERIRILRGKAKDLDEESIRVISAMPPWTPGFLNGLPVAVQFNLPIKFSLR